MALKNIQRRSVSDEVYDQLMRAIVSGEWTPGAKIPSENELVNELGVSRVSVRAAVQRLSSLGLLESRQGEGTFVTEHVGSSCLNGMIPFVALGKVDLRYFLELRTILDAEMAAIAAQRIEPAQLEKMEACLTRHEQCASDARKASACDLEFHYLVAVATQNPFLTQLYAIFKDTFRYALDDIVSVMGIEHAMYYHRKLIDAFAAHDAETARRVMQEHIEDTVASFRTETDGAAEK